MGGLRPPSKPPQPRGLQEAGRQNSTDSGIATGSHSSYSGSFSSYTESMDTGHGETDEFGSLISFPPNTLNSNTPARTVTLIPEHMPCVCPLRDAADLATGHQVPNPALQYYDIPRRLVQPHTSDQEEAADQERRPESGALGLEDISADASLKQTVPVRFNWCSEGAAPPEVSNMPELQPAICPDCGGGKVTRFAIISLILLTIVC